MKNILIPTDFSQNAWNALRYATSLFKKTRCTFYILHVDPIVHNEYGDGIARESPELVENIILQESKQKLQAWLDKVERLPLNSKHTFVTSAIYGLFTDSLKKQIEENKIDLIAMGTKGATGLKKVTIGSNTGNVMTKVKCPLLAVPEDAEYHHPREIAFPTDYHLNYNVKVLDDLKDLAIMHSSALRFLYISQKGEEFSNGQLKNQRFLSDYFADLEHTLHKITGQKLEAAVQCFTESRDVDMIVMVAKNLNFLQRILFRPRVEKISYHTKIPFLVLHE